MFPIPGYSFIHNSRKTRIRGGVAMYILDEFTFRERPDLAINHEGEFESIIAEIEPKQGGKKLMLAEIYRIPNTSQRESIARFESIMTGLQNTNSDIMMGSDTNFDFMKGGSDRNISDLLDIFISLGTLPTCLTPTRVTHTSHTLIDNVFVKCDRYEGIGSRTLLTNISDHFPVLTCMGKKVKTQTREPLTFYNRHIGAEQITKISKLLSETDWDANLHSENIDQSYQDCMATLTKALDTHAPITKTTIPFKQVIRQPWMTSGLIKCSRKCDRLYAKSIGKGQNTESCQNFTRYRNVYNSIKRKAKAKYFTDLLQNYANDIRKTWRVLNSITWRKNDKSTISDTFIVDGKKETNKETIANGFGSYFANVGRQFADAIPKANKQPSHYTKCAPNLHSLYLFPTDTNEISKILGKCANKKSAGDDGISLVLLKQLSSTISYPIAKLVNMSFEQGVFPTAMKIAKVIPIYKGKSKELFTNYRPISLLSNVSKVLEKESNA